MKMLTASLKQLMAVIPTLIYIAIPLVDLVAIDSDSYISELMGTHAMYMQ